MKKIGFIVGILLLIFASCRKRESDINWDVDMAYPLAYGSLGIENILPDSLLQVNPDSSISIRFETALLSLTIDSLASIPDTTLELAYALPLFIPITVAPGQQIINNPEENKLSIDGAELTEVVVKSGKVNYRIESTIPGDIIYTYTIPSAKDANGVVFSKTLNIPKASSSANSLITGSFDLDNYKVDLTGLNGNKTNTLLTTVTAKLSPTNDGSITVSNTDTLYISNTLSDVKIESALGYFGQHDFQIGPASTYLSFFKKIVSGTINITDLIASIKIENGVGVDAFLKINSLISRHDADAPIALQHELIGENNVLNRAYKIADEVYPSSLIFNLNAANSNLETMLESLPDSVGYDAQVTINPLGNVAAFNDFVYADSPLRVILNIDMPLNAIANNLQLADTLELDIADSSPLNDLKLFIDLENGFPMSATVQLFILDGNNMPVGTLLVPGVIPSAILNSNNTVQQTAYSAHTLTLLPKDLENLQRYKKLALKLTFDSPQNNHIYIYDYNRLKFNVRAQSNIKISIR